MTRSRGFVLRVVVGLAARSLAVDPLIHPEIVELTVDIQRVKDRSNSTGPFSRRDRMPPPAPSMPTRHATGRRI